ncbi:hypothetical protein [Sphingomonas sp. S-NIH.Pt15_0812]|uniref:hypothetical protein n=1 Tax=Sphingomonas sp. S-NIH.Pt15_0812 TaxID=1920129 RepID=UPI000F7F7347|nr:hypothetical protein [Sphingomonas sp. S-NIH.Pt15_0812]
MSENQRLRGSHKFWELGLCVAIAGMILPNAATASSAEGLIKRFGYSGSRVFVWIDTTRNGASCNTPGAGDRYELDQGSAGQSQMAILLTAYSSKQRVFVSGTNACPSDTETIGYAETRP